MLTALTGFAQRLPLPTMLVPPEQKSVPDGLGYNIHFIDGTRNACGPYSIDVYPPVLVYGE